MPRAATARFLLAALTASVLVSACSAATGRLEGEGRKPSRDEVALLAQANAEERRIRAAGTVIEDPLLQPFLDAVAARLCVSFGIDASLVRVLALRDSSENAGALPNGVLIVYSGLFARLENEAQLAGVLSHLLERFVGRHALKSHRSAKTAAGFGLLGAIVSPTIPGAPIVAVEPQRSAGQNADQILEADRAALLAMIAAGYDGEQMVAAMQALAPRTSESSPAMPTEAGYPQTAVRIARMREQLVAMQADGRLGSDARAGTQEYQSAVAGVLAGSAAQGSGHFGFTDRPVITPNRRQGRRWWPGMPRRAVRLAAISWAWYEPRQFGAGVEVGPSPASFCL